jgi:hypothetical protein
MNPLVLLGLVALVLFGLYLGYEAYRWSSGNRGGLVAGQFRRRMLIGVMLEAAIALGFIVPGLATGQSRQELWLKLVCMLLAVLLAGLSILFALREAAFVARQFAHTRGDLMRGVGTDRSDDGAA